MTINRYPIVLFFRYDKYNDADEKVSNLKCDVRIINNNREVEKLYDNHYHILATYGPHEFEYIPAVMSVLCNRLRKRWIHFTNINPQQFEHGVNYCYIDNVVKDREASRPLFSIFTTCFNSYDKIYRPYSSLKNQTERDWEWVIVDDSTDEKHFQYLKDKFINEPKIRIYNRSGNSGSIGNVKNEAIALCRGKYVLELDHDDNILPDLIKDAVLGFKKYPDVGFVYMDFTNLYENGGNFSYGDFCSKGYAGYYYQKYDNRWVKVLSTPQINNITMTHLYCMPNHPRIWNREFLLKIGSYSEFLPICDDLEALLRTCYETKMLKIAKLAYVQYFNESGNFSLIRNEEINRIGPQFIVPQSKEHNKFNERFIGLEAWEHPVLDYNPVQIWRRDDEPKYANYLFNPDYDLQVCIIGVENLLSNMERIKDLYRNTRHDFFLIDNKGVDGEIVGILESRGLQRIKFYILLNEPVPLLINYFNRVYKSVNNTIIIQEAKREAPITNTIRGESGIIDQETKSEFVSLIETHLPTESVVLELGAGYGSISCAINKKLKNKTNQVSVEPYSNMWDYLNLNKINNNCEFNILKGAISKKPLKLLQQNSITRTLVCETSSLGKETSSLGKETSSLGKETSSLDKETSSLDKETSAVNVFTLEEIETRFGLKFNVLVAECEGFLAEFLEENQNLYKQLNLIIFEKDCPDSCDYDKILNGLKENKFINLATGLYEAWMKRD